MPKGGGGGGGGGGGHRRWMGDSRELDPEVTSWLVSTRARAKCSGQVQESNGKGLAISLYRLALLVSGALEIGTFKGCGSTLIIAKGLLDGGTGGKLWTVESDEEIAKEARRAMTISNLPVDVIHGMGSPAHMILPLNDILSYLPANQRQQNPLEEYHKWYRGEKAAADALAAKGQAAVIERLCYTEHQPIELVFLDGAEFYGTADLHQVLRFCPRVRFIGMDDINMFKHHSSMEELKRSPGWGFTLCLESPPGGDRPGGWGIWARDEEADKCQNLTASVGRPRRFGR